MNKDDSYPIGSADIYYSKHGSPTKFEENDSKTHQVYKFKTYIFIWLLDIIYTFYLFWN